MAERRCAVCSARFMVRGGRPTLCRRCRAAKAAGDPFLPAGRPRFAARGCERCGRSYVPAAWNAKFCAGCRPVAKREGDAALYGQRHRKAKAAYAPLVASGGAVCPRCGKRIRPGEAWDLDHGDSPVPGQYAGPAHASCNRAAPMKNRKRRAW